MSGDVMHINAGETSKLWFNDVLQATSSGGQSTYAREIAPANCNHVKLYQGGNDSVATYPVHWHKGNQNTYGDCYTVAVYRHDHNGGCYGHVCDGACHYVEGHYEWVYNDNDDGEDTDGWHKKWIPAHTDHSGNKGLVCGGNPLNTFDHWGLGCGYENGQIVGIQPQVIGYSDNTWVADSSAQDNAGDGKFSIQLVEQDRLYYDSGLANNLTYRNNVANLVVYQDPKTNEHYALFVKHTQH